MPLRLRSAVRAAAAWRSVRENLAARVSRSAHLRVRRRAHARGALQVWNRYPSPQCFKERLQKDVVNKRLSPNQEEAVIERMVTYNDSEKVCIYTYIYTHACVPVGSGPQHSVRRLPGSGQVQCTSWRNFAPFSSSTFKTIHGEQAGKRDRGGSAVGARHIVREHATTQTVFNKHTASGKAAALGVPREEVLGIKVLCALGPAFQGRSARPPSPRRAAISFFSSRGILNHSQFFICIQRYYRGTQGD